MDRRLSRACAAFAACAAAATLAACGGGSGSGDGPSGDGGTYSKATIEKRLAEDYAGTFKELPSGGPKAVAGKRIAIVPLTQLSATMSDFTREATAAAEAIGWESFVVDGKLTTQGNNTAIRQATAQHPDAILIVAINCPPVQQAVIEAKKAGITVFSVYGDDCETPQWDGNQPVDLDGSARQRADWLAAKVGPNGKVAELYLTDDPVTKRLQDKTEQALKDVCPDCEIARIEWVLSDLGEPLKGKVQTGLLRNPDAKGFVAPFDAAVTFGAGAAIQGSGLDLEIMGGECAGPNLELIRAGVQQHACTGYPFSVFGWSAIDGLNRLFAGEQPVDAGLGVQLVDLEHNMPAKGEPFFGPLTDFREHYKRSWGVG
jgi:ribose transport system substrate-binding protein